MELIAVLAVLLLFGGSIAGLLAFISLRSTREDLRNLQIKLARLNADVSALTLTIEADQPVSSSEARELLDNGQEDQRSGEGQFGESPGFQEQAQAPESLSDASTWEETSEPDRTDEFTGPHPIVRNLQDHWMIWLGGACVALAGIFLVRYSIEQGLLGPTGRFTAGLATGLGLHAAAEYFRRKTGSVHPSFAAMAGAGSITLFAALLVGLRLFELISPGTHLY